MSLDSEIKVIELENYDSQEKSSLSVLSFEKFIPFKSFVSILCISLINRRNSSRCFLYLQKVPCIK